MPKVSVIVPVYGVEKYIERCARSLFEQTLDDIEYLFIDDCTPDRSIDILQQVLEEYPQRKPQVVIHRMEKNSGQAAVRKWGMQNATGEYVIHCDSDDWVETDMYRAMYEKAKEEDLDYVVCNYYETDGVNKKKVEQHISAEKTEMMFKFVTLWLRLVKRSIVQNKSIIYPTSNMGEDRVLTAQYSFFSNSWGVINSCLYNYFINPESISRVYTLEQSIDIFYQRKSNTDILIQLIKEKQIPACDIELSKQKLITLTWLHPYIKDEKVYKIWKNTYPELLRDCFTKRDIGFKNRIRYIAIWTRIYQIYMFFAERNLR